MNTRRLALLFALIFGTAAHSLFAQQAGRIQSFSPQGVAKKIRQVRVMFSEPMVSFGDPRAGLNPFDIRCTEKGTGRWADPLNWTYDFERDLPAGIRCEFIFKKDFQTLAGNSVAGQSMFWFSSGGPAVTRSFPREGSEAINEDQIFVLELDGEATERSLLSSVRFSIGGISELVGMRIVTGQEKEAILQSQYPTRYRGKRPDHLLLIQAKQRFPAGSKVSLVWGKGVSSPSGIATDQDQILSFKTQQPFTASFHCRRENAAAGCIPITDMWLSFSAAVPWKTAKRAVLTGPGGKVWTPETRQGDSQEEDDDVWQIGFRGPFPENSSFVLQLPSPLEDDAGRKLSNAGSFPLELRTDEYPPLAKFAADFGILELKAGAALPVTLRNIEPEIAARSFQVEGGDENFDPLPPRPSEEDLDADLKGKVLKVPPDKASQMLAWIRKASNRRWEGRDRSIFGSVTQPKTKTFTLPKLHGSKPFEVLGIPLKEPGFYVVEIESEILGASLLGISKPMFVPTTVLVTDLSVHFKWGAESSLIWVTTLDKAVPVKQAALQVCDCEGKILWKGTSDGNGLARVGALPREGDLPYCSYSAYGRGLFVTAQSGNDFSFTHSNWNDGIESWRFRLPTEWTPNFTAAHTVMDRSLLRAGEIIHMKHILRGEVLAGLALKSIEQAPRTLIIRHLGSEQKYEFSLKWDASGIAETDWSIPREARLGQYNLYLRTAADKNRQSRYEYIDEPDGLQYTGSFRVEEFRVPLMRALIRPPATPLISPSAVPVDMTVSYLSGGSAGNLPVRFRYDVRTRYVSGFPDFSGYIFSNGSVKEGVFRSDSEEETPGEAPVLKSRDLTLDKSGSARTEIEGLPPAGRPMEILAELEFRDPNGEIQTASSKIPLWPADRLIGIQPDVWMQSRDAFQFQVAVLDLQGRPLAGIAVKVDAFRKKTFSHRKRLVGGFYAFEHFTETRLLGPICEGKTDKQGILLCAKAPAASGQIVLQASAPDSAGRQSTAYTSMWIAGEDEWWFEARDDDRIDLLPERKRYEPGQKAKLQVRMPFRKATALITVEREGVGEAFVRELSGKQPVIEIPVKSSYAPNVFVSVLVIRGRAGGIQPTATVDLGRPAYKLGIAELNVGWKAHELKVKVSTDRQIYRAREKAKVQVSVTTPEGAPPPKGTEVALAAVDEGLLELAPNSSWDLLDVMMGRRSYNVRTATAQMHVIGKRHFGLKALPQGGGGGGQMTRELFDTLLIWKARVPLDEKGSAWIDVPINDSITGFRIVAVASSLDRFGTGTASIRSTRDLVIFSGISPVVRQGDTFRSTFTLRNTAEKAMQVKVSASVSGISEAVAPQSIALNPGESRDISWNFTAPAGIDSLKYSVEANAGEGIRDRISVSQKVLPAVPIQTLQATLTQLAGDYRLELERPKDAVPGMGSIDVSLTPTLVGGLTGIEDYMNRYPYTCLEQNVSKAIALRDSGLWNRIVANMPAYMDSSGLLKYFPRMSLGSEILTAYVLSISDEAGWTIPLELKERMIQGLRDFIEGRILRRSALPTADLSIRKIMCIEALSRSGQAEPAMLTSITIEPNLWPTSAVLDWYGILKRIAKIRDREARMSEAEQILRTRLNFQGTTMNFSTERTDRLWWLMMSPDANAVRLLLSVMDASGWKADISRIVRGALARQHRGRWDTTVANAWGVLAVGKFAKSFEKTPVSGSSTASLEGSTRTLDWAASPGGKTLSFPWPSGKAALALQMTGTGRPWATVRGNAAMPRKEPFSSGYKIRKTLTAIEQKERGKWSRGDIVRVTLNLEAQADMTWVVAEDPIPAGSTILGTGLGRDSGIAVKGEKQTGWVWPAFEERSFEAFRAYYEYVPKGSWSVEYTIRLNNEGVMNLPPTRVEAMYSPEMFGELPNEAMRIQ